MMSQTSITRRRVSTFLADESGPTAVEYTVMLSLVAVSCIGAAISLGGAAADTFSDTSSKLANAVSAKSGNGKGSAPAFGGNKSGGSNGNGWAPKPGGSFPAFGSGGSRPTTGANGRSGKGKK